MQRIKDYKGYNILKFFDVLESFSHLSPSRLVELTGSSRSELLEGPVDVILGAQTIRVKAYASKMPYYVVCPECGEEGTGNLLFPHPKDPRRKKVWACKTCHGAAHSSYLYGGDSAFEKEVFSPLRRLRKAKDKLKTIFEKGKSISPMALADLIDEKNRMEAKLTNNKRYQLYREVLESGGLTDVIRPRS